MKVPFAITCTPFKPHLDKMDIAYTFYLRTSTWILMIITKVEEGCHITSMAGTWMSIVRFWRRIKDDDWNTRKCQKNGAILK
jgi:trehalose/maltose hydrolase-like predicted phosphorylase